MTQQRLKYETFLQFKREIIQLRILGLFLTDDLFFLTDLTDYTDVEIESVKSV